MVGKTVSTGNISITGNVITHINLTMLDGPNSVVGFIQRNPQVSVMAMADNKYSVSYPMTEADHEIHRGLIHRLNTENRLTKKGPSDPDGKPPRPTNPRGSGGKVVEFENTLAIAA